MKQLFLKAPPAKSSMLFYTVICAALITLLLFFAYSSQHNINTDRYSSSSSSSSSNSRQYSSSKISYSKEAPRNGHHNNIHRKNNKNRNSNPQDGNQDGYEIPCAPEKPKLKHETRIALINRHQGTGDDFRYVSKQLGFTFTEINPTMWQPMYGQTRAQADDLNLNNLGTFFCDGFDLIVVQDTNPDARFMLQRVDTFEYCHANVVVVSTNRFDISIPDSDMASYYDLVRRLSLRPDGKVKWVANNPWEKKYSILKLGYDYLDYTMIRPMGLSNLPVSEPYPEEDRRHPVIINYPQTIEFKKVLDNARIPYKLLPRKYGGPTVLRQFKAFISIPYQTSTMKMYENIAHGVVTIVPTARYLRVLLSQPGYNLHGTAETLAAGEDWYKFIELYGEDLKGFFYTFDSMDELAEILSRDIVDTRNVRERGPEYWERHRVGALEKWEHVLFGRFSDKSSSSSSSSS